ncbi:MAG: helix-turn-helix domain-containing protein [Sandaracinaceae bacterium]|nr:helix-turn-helix domain-containing protein [Sandaracinaceae bacterium]
MSVSSVSTDPFRGVCNGCPAERRDVFESLVRGGKGACAFPCASVSARATLPDRWFDLYGFAFVRRGILIRQCVDENGVTTALDAAGAGALVALDRSDDRIASAGYAVSDLLVCLYPRTVLDTVVENGGQLVRELMTLQAQAAARLDAFSHARAQPNAVNAAGALLLALADTLSPPKMTAVIPSSLQQRDMAALLGLRHETVCRAVAQLVSRGALQRDTEGFRIVDRALLTAA